MGFTRFIAITLLASFLFAGCDALAVGTENLLRAPTLNAKQAEVSLALEATLNLQDVIYRYPTRGATPILFHDLDGDEVDEAIVFYSLASRQEEIRVKILRRNDSGAWAHFYDVPDQGDQVEFIEFADLISADAPCMLLGWYNSSRQERRMEIYYRTERQYSGAYTAYTIADNPGGQPRLLLAAQEKRGAPFELRLLGSSGSNIDRLASIALEAKVEQVVNMRQSNLWDRSRAVFLDEIVDGDTVATEIIRYTANAFELVAGGGNGPGTPEEAYYKETFRPDPELSMDVDGDGEVEIPFYEAIPGIEESDEIAPVRMTVFKRPVSGGLMEDSRAVVNRDAGYLLFFPPRWLENVTVMDSPEASQRSFHAYDGHTQLPGRELLRIAAYSSHDYEEEPGGYFLLAERSNLRYYAFLPELAGEPLALTQNELRRLFALI